MPRQNPLPGPAGQYSPHRSLRSLGGETIISNLYHHADDGRWPAPNLGASYPWEPPMIVLHPHCVEGLHAAAPTELTDAERLAE